MVLSKRAPKMLEEGFFR